MGVRTRIALLDRWLGRELDLAGGLQPPPPDDLVEEDWEDDPTPEPPCPWT